jgi:hypothetical protein
MILFPLPAANNGPTSLVHIYVTSDFFFTPKHAKPVSSLLHPVQFNLSVGRPIVSTQIQRIKLWESISQVRSHPYHHLVVTHIRRHLVITWMCETVFVLFQNVKQCVPDDRLNKADCAVLCVVAHLDWITWTSCLLEFLVWWYMIRSKSYTNNRDW